MWVSRVWSGYDESEKAHNSVSSVITRRLADEPVADIVRRDARFIDEDVGACIVERLRVLPPAARGGDVRPSLFVGVYGSLTVRPKRSIVLLIAREGATAKLRLFARRHRAGGSAPLYQRDRPRRG